MGEHDLDDDLDGLSEEELHRRRSIVRQKLASVNERLELSTEQRRAEAALAIQARDVAIVQLRHHGADAPSEVIDYVQRAAATTERRAAGVARYLRSITSVLEDSVAKLPATNPASFGSYAAQIRLVADVVDAVGREALMLQLAREHGLIDT